MKEKLETAIVASAEKDYSKFEKNVSDMVSTKMTTHLSGFMTYLETNAFKKD